ncbi:M20 family metallopeptidase [Fusobacterium ulcerans]|uniref:amidohydrolase n=1 Tax=Fusobacterium ulcerans TaxID=861 RepID=UPI0026735570|nr:amidohydrolase [Fusobacterium ulcerans]
MIENEYIEKLIDEVFDEILAFRRDIHKYPELSNDEKETSKKIIKILKGNNIDDLKLNSLNYGIIGQVNSYENKKTLLLRADMDGLPLMEETNLPYSSQNSHIMHACGHDFHSSILLGVIIILNKLKEKLNGNVRFMFQHAEENSPIGGSKEMISLGVLEDVDEAYAMHVLGIPLGKIEICPGVATAKSDRFKIKISGKSCHGSLPNEGKDPIIVAGNIIASIQTIISRNLSYSEKAVISIGKIYGGDRYNIIANNVIMEGTVRTFGDKINNIVKVKLKEIIEYISKAYGCIGELEYTDGYVSVYNDISLSNDIKNILENTLGKENVIINTIPTSIGEDFSYISRKVPSVFMWIGGESEKNKGLCKLHSSKFIADERILKIGMKSLINVVVNRLS